MSSWRPNIPTPGHRRPGSGRCAPPSRSWPISRRCLPTRRTDAEMRALAEADLPEVEERIEALQQDIQILLLPKDAADEKNAILEIRAGTGGDEAALFAGDLFRMYERYAASQGWRFEVVSASEGEVGGYKEIIATVSGKGVFAQAEIRVRRAPRAARAGDRRQRAHPHLGRDRRRAAGGRRGRYRDPRRGHPHRHDARLRLRRPARQHHRFGGAHHPSADRHHGGAGGEVAAPEPGAGDADPARAALRPGTQQRRRRSAPNRASRRSARATARSASAPTISRKGGSPTTAST